MANLYLVGMMGSGKSVTGRRLAAMIGYGFLDLDQMIQDRVGCSINEIFEKKGEPFFREREAELLNEASSDGPRVIATGGGAVLKPENVRRMKETGRVVYLDTSLDVLWERVKAKKDRPLLKSDDPKAKLSEILQARLALYRSAGDLTVQTDGKTAEAVAQDIVKLLEKKK